MISDQDLEYYSHLPLDELNVLLSQMTATVNLLSQGGFEIGNSLRFEWFRRAWRATARQSIMKRSDISRYRKELCEYVIEVVQSLYSHEHIDPRILPALSVRFRALCAQKLRFNENCEKFIEKFISLTEQFNRYGTLLSELENGSKGVESSLVTICCVVAQMDAKILHNSDLLATLHQRLLEHGVISENDVPLASLLEQMTTLSTADAGLISMGLQGSTNSLFAILIQKIISSCNESDELQAGKSVISDLLEQELLDCNAQVDTVSIYDDLLASIIDAVDRDQCLMTRFDDKQKQQQTRPIPSERKRSLPVEQSKSYNGEAKVSPYSTPMKKSSDYASSMNLKTNFTSRSVQNKKSTVNLGGTVSFGKDPNTDTAILWRVLDIDLMNGLVLLLAERAVDSSISYHDYYDSVTWAECSLREWLNNDFIQEYFRSFERRKIIRKQLTNKANEEYAVRGGKSTRDQVFLLSIEEFELYTQQIKHRICLDQDDNTCKWWLRSPGGDKDRAAFVRTNGKVSAYGEEVGCSEDDNYISMAVRPALWCSLDFFDR